MQIYYDNKIFKGTLTVSSQQSGFPISNLQDRSREVPLRFASKIDEDVVVDAGAGDTYTVDAIALFNYNLTSGTTITLQGNATDSWGAPSFSQTITWTAGVIAEIFTSQTYRFFRIRFQDSGNSDPISIGIIYLGVKVDIASIAPQPALDVPTSTNQSFTRSRQVRGVKKRNYLKPSFNLSHVTELKRQELLGIWDEVMNVDTFVLIIWENSVDIQAPIYCVFEMRKMAFNKNKYEGLSWTSKITIVEVF